MWGCLLLGVVGSGCYDLAHKAGDPFSILNCGALGSVNVSILLGLGCTKHSMLQ